MAGRNGHVRGLGVSVRPPALTLQTLTQAVRRLDEVDTVADTLSAVCTLAAEMTHADDAGVTVMSHGRPATRGGTTSLPDDVDSIQYRLDEGPCVDASRETRVVRTGDLTADSRWPHFGPEAARAYGVRSMMSHHLSTGRGRRGALNLYARRTEAFDPAEELALSLFAAHAAIAVHAAETREQRDNLSVALDSNRTIGMALGILMSTHGVDRDAAWTALKTQSQRTNRRVIDLAEDIVWTGTL